jgi:hypothetical protein
MPDQGAIVDDTATEGVVVLLTDGGEDEELPPPSEGMPKYLWEPLQKQTIGGLESAIEYAEELLEYKQRPVAMSSTSDSGKTVAEKTAKDLSREQQREAKEEFLEMSSDERKALSDDQLARYGHVQIRKVPCGPGCDGCPHGPYRFVVLRDTKGEVTTKYAGKARE